MPTYLLHGFRWPRYLVRIYVIQRDLDDAAPDWLMATATTTTLLNTLGAEYPSYMPHLDGLRFIEQYDPEDESISSQPYAYVADTVVEVKLGVDVEEIRGFGLSEEKWTSILGLRDGLCQGHSPMPKLGWYVVVCGDEERLAPSIASSSDPTSSSVSDNHDGDDEEGEGEGDEEEEQEVEEEERVEEAVGLVAIAPSTTTNTSSQTPPAVPEPAAVKSSKVKRTTSIASSIRQLFKFQKATKADVASQPGPRLLRPSRSSRSIKSLMGMRSGETSQTSPESPPPLPGTAQ